MAALALRAGHPSGKVETRARAESGAIAGTRQGVGFEAVHLGDIRADAGAGAFGAARLTEEAE